MTELLICISLAWVVCCLAPFLLFDLDLDEGVQKRLSFFSFYTESFLEVDAAAAAP